MGSVGVPAATGRRVWLTVTCAATTALAMSGTLAAVFRSSFLQGLPRSEVPMWVWLPVALVGIVGVLGLVAGCWGWVVAALLRSDRRATAVAAARTTLVLALPVGFAVDMSQLLIGVVWLWHPLAVHVVCTLAFAGGLAWFLGRLATRVLPAQRPGAGVVALAAAAGVVVAGVLAVPLGLTVVRGMGMRMLDTLDLLVAVGAAAGGGALAWVASGHGEVLPVGVTRPAEADAVVDPAR